MSSTKKEVVTEFTKYAYPPAETVTDDVKYARVAAPGWVELYNPITKTLFSIQIWPEADSLTNNPNVPGGQTVEQGLNAEQEVTQISDDDDQDEMAAGEVATTEDNHDEETEQKTEPEQTIEPEQEDLETEICPYRLLRLECSHFCKRCLEHHRCFICWMLQCPDLLVFDRPKKDKCLYFCREAQGRFPGDFWVDGRCTYREAIEYSRQLKDLGPDFQPKCTYEPHMLRQIRSDAASGSLTAEAYEVWVRELFSQALQEAKLVAGALKEAVETPDTWLARDALKTAHAQRTASISPTPDPMHNTGPNISPQHSPSATHSSFASLEDQLSNYSDRQTTSAQPSRATRNHRHASRAQKKAASSSNSNAMRGRRSDARVKKHPKPAGSSRTNQQTRRTRRNQDQVSSALTSVSAREDQRSASATEANNQMMEASQSNVTQVAGEGELVVTENRTKSCPYCPRLDHEEALVGCTNKHETNVNKEGDAEKSEKEMTREVWCHYSCASLKESEAESIPNWYCWECVYEGRYPEWYDTIAGRVMRRKAKKLRDQKKDSTNGDPVQVNDGHANASHAEDQTVGTTRVGATVNTSGEPSVRDTDTSRDVAEKTVDKDVSPGDHESAVKRKDSNSDQSGGLENEVAVSSDEEPRKTGQARHKRGSNGASKSKDKEASEAPTSSDDEPRKLDRKTRESSDSDSDDFAPSKGQARIKRGSQKLPKTKGKRASQNRPPPAQVSGTQKRQTKGWEGEESQYVHDLMQNLMQDDPKVAKTEERWRVISQQLKALYNIDRSWSSVKNYWNRKGRLATGLDERRKQDPNRLVTGAQDPAQRRRARQAKMGVVEGSDEEENEQDDIEEDDYEGDEEDGGQHDTSVGEKGDGQYNEQKDGQREKENDNGNGEKGGKEDEGQDGGQDKEQDEGENAKEVDKQNGEQDGEGVVGKGGEQDDEEDGGHGTAKKRGRGDDDDSGDEEDTVSDASSQKRRKL